MVIPLVIQFFYENWAKQNLPTVLANVLTYKPTPALVALVCLVLLFLVATWPHIVRGKPPDAATGSPAPNVPPGMPPAGTPPSGFVGNNYGTVNIYPGVQPVPTTQIHEVPGGLTTTGPEAVVDIPPTGPPADHE